MTDDHKPKISSPGPFRKCFHTPALDLTAITGIPNKRPSNVNVPQNKDQQYLKEYRTATLSNINSQCVAPKQIFQARKYAMQFDPY